MGCNSLFSRVRDDERVGFEVLYVKKHKSP